MAQTDYDMLPEDSHWDRTDLSAEVPSAVPFLAGRDCSVLLEPTRQLPGSAATGCSRTPAHTNKQQHYGHHRQYLG